MNIYEIPTINPNSYTTATGTFADMMRNMLKDLSIEKIANLYKQVKYDPVLFLTDQAPTVFKDFMKNDPGWVIQKLPIFVKATLDSFYGEDKVDEWVYKIDQLSQTVYNATTEYANNLYNSTMVPTAYNATTEYANNLYNSTMVPTAVNGTTLATTTDDNNMYYTIAGVIAGLLITALVFALACARYCGKKKDNTTNIEDIDPKNHEYHDPENQENDEQKNSLLDEQYQAKQDELDSPTNNEVNTEIGLEKKQPMTPHMRHRQGIGGLNEGERPHGVFGLGMTQQQGAAPATSNMNIGEFFSLEPTEIKM